MAEEAETKEVPEEAGTAEIEEADPTVGVVEVEAPVMLTNPHPQPVTSIGPMGKVPGSVLTGTTVPGGTTSRHAPRTTGTLWLKQK